MDGGLVPRAPPRPAARLAGRRPRAAQGRWRLLRRRPLAHDRGDAWLRRPVRTVPEPDRPLPADRAAYAWGVRIRPITDADREFVRPLWDEFEVEVPSP